MAVFTCKMCGGTLEIEEGMLIATCKYCGTKQTLPRLLSDKTANLYDRANHFRRNNEFDKARNIYERILDEDTTDSEAYWSIVLCMYGIEYVEDPGTHRRVPTVNRIQYTSIYDDDNYKLALQHATPDQRTIYENEARAINEIQKGFLEISQNEEPFDVFICYKETDKNGERTHDSVLAQDIYYQLVERNLRVFFSRITLEDKLGTEYEPYIFAALMSAKVMIVLGTKPEYFNAAWVRNEWTRYLSLTKNSSERKTLIPAFRDMDPYDLPEEFSHLQAQDMNKIGCVQDLVRGVCKIVNKEPERVVVKKDDPIVVSHVKSEVSKEEALVQRAFIFLEDKEWSSAAEYFEKALDIDPKYAMAYVGKMLAELKLTRIEMLAQCQESFETNSNYKKAMRFADPKLAQTLNSYLTVIKERSEVLRKDAIYRAACAMMSGRRYDEAIEKFTSIVGWRDSRDRIEICKQSTKKNSEKFDSDRKNRIYNEAIALLNAENRPATNLIEGCGRAKSLFEGLGDWNDSKIRVEECTRRINVLKEKAAQEKADKEKQAKLKAVQNKKKAKKFVLVLLAIAVGFAILVGLINIGISISEKAKVDKKYQAAVELANTGMYEQAIEAFKDLGDYKQSKEYIDECEKEIINIEYNRAIGLMQSGKYQEAITAFETLGDYKESVAKINICKNHINSEKYNQAMELMDKGQYKEAIELFEELDEYKDSKNQMDICKSKLENSQ